MRTSLNNTNTCYELQREQSVYPASLLFATTTIGEKSDQEMTGFTTVCTVWVTSRFAFDKLGYHSQLPSGTKISAKRSGAPI